MFTNLRTRYSRDRKKLKQAKVSGSGADGVSKVKDEAGDMFPYLAWLDPFYKPRKTVSNFITVDSENEESEVDEPTNQDDTSPEKENISDIREKGKVSSHVSDDLSSNNFRPHKKSKLHSKAKARMNQDVLTAEVEVLQSIGAALGQIGRKQTTSSSLKDEDELFGALIASQLHQIAPERKVRVKMQVYNILYQEVLASFSRPSESAPYITSSVPYSSHQMHSSQENSARNQSLRRPYQVPNVLEESGEEPVLRPGHLFYQNQTNQPHMRFLDDLNGN